MYDEIYLENLQVLFRSVYLLSFMFFFWGKSESEFLNLYIFIWISKIYELTVNP